MPLIQVKFFDETFTTSQKKQMVSKLTDAMVLVGGENLRLVTWVVIEQPPSREVGIGGRSVTNDAVCAMGAGQK